MAPEEEDFHKDLDEIDGELKQIKVLIGQLAHHENPWWHKFLGWPLTAFLIMLLFWTGFNYKIVQDNFNDISRIMDRQTETQKTIAGLEREARYNQDTHNDFRQRMGRLELDLKEVLKELRESQ